MKSNAITPIDNTEIFISSYPSAHQIVFIKLQYDKDYEEPDDLKDEDMRYLITKDNYYFCASNPFSKLYFILLDDKDSKLEEYFDKLKKIK